MVKEIDKSIQGVENGYDKFYYEIQHMLKYSDTGLFPKIYKIDDKPDRYSVIMEYCYHGMTLSDLIRNQNVDLSCFENSFDYIMTDVMHKLYSKHYGSYLLSDYIEQCYYSRVVNRISLITESNMLDQYKFSNILYRIVKDGCYINEEYYPPAYEYIEFMRKNECLSELLKITFSCHAHYDLCPMNIVVDYNFDEGRIKDYRLIDVRGEDDTGPGKRHYIYDMGKMLLGLDAFDLFRIFNGRDDKKSYLYQVDATGEKVLINFKFIKGGIAERYKTAEEHFWLFFENRNYCTDILLDTPENLKTKFLFSQSMMYLPDVPCRIIYEKCEESAILIFLRGIVLMRHFLESVFGKDPVGKFSSSINIWEGL